MPYDARVEKLQRILVKKFGEKIDVDGLWGNNTQQALLRNVEPIIDPLESDIYGIGEEDNVLGPFPKIDIEWKTQFDDAYKADLLRPGGRTIQHSGCYVACMAMCLDTTVPAIVAELNERNGFYKETSMIDWNVIKEMGGKRCLQNVGFDRGLEYLQSGNPIILHFPRGHFVVAIGLADESHFRVLDPGSGMGNGNTMDNQKTIIHFDEVDRVDVLV